MNDQTIQSKAIFLVAGILPVALLNGFGQPVISTQPQNQTNYVGTTATFTVVAAGVEPLNYQWQDFTTSWQNMAHRTNAVLALTNVQINNAKDYRVVVTDATGTTNSAAGHLYVTTPDRLFISNPAPGLVTLSWQGNMVLLEAITPDSGPLDCAKWFWFRVADTSPATLPVRSGARFFRLVALPTAAELQAAFESNLDKCTSLFDPKACEECVAYYFLMGPTGALPVNPAVGEAYSVGFGVGSCFSSALGEVLDGLSDGIQPQP